MKFGTPTYFCDRSNFVHNLGLGLAYQKTTFRTNIGGVLAFRTNIGGGLGQGSIQNKNWRGSGPREHPNKIWEGISATVEANNFKCGMQLGFGTSLPKNNV